MATTEPTMVSEKFWLNLAAQSITTSFEKRAAGAKRLKDLITWAYGLLAATGIIGSIFGEVKTFPIESLIAFGVGYALLTIAYGLAGEAEYPVTKNYHPNDTEAIANAFSEAVKYQTNYFKAAAVVAFAGLAGIAFAILFLFFSAKEKAPVAKEELYPIVVNSSVIRTNDSLLKIPVTIMTVPVADTVSIAILSGKNKEIVLFKEAYKTDTAGRIYTVCPVKLIKGDSSQVWLHTTIRVPDKTDSVVKYKVTRLSIPR